MHIKVDDLTGTDIQKWLRKTEQRYKWELWA